MADIKRVDVTKNFIRVRLIDPGKFQEDSFRVVDIDEEQGIKAVMGKLKGEDKMTVQAYLFDKRKGWTVEKSKKWVQEHQTAGLKSKAELLAENKTIVTANMVVCKNQPNLNMPSFTPDPFSVEEFKAAVASNSLQDKYFFFAEGVHSGANKNGDAFTKEELTKHYKSAAIQLVDYEHNRSWILGATLDSELLTKDDGTLAVAVSGALWRLSPYMSIEVEGATIDQLIQDRFENGNLAISMEVLFDSFNCSLCEANFTDFLEFEHHKVVQHMDDNPSRVLNNISFIGFGIVLHPADPQAYVMSLKMCDEVACEEFARATVDFDPVQKNNLLAKAFAHSVPDVVLEEERGFVIANTPENTDDVNTNDTKGEPMMFNLSAKTKDCTSLSDIFVVAQTVLKDYMGDDSTLTPEQSEAFASELKEVVQAHISNESFKIPYIYTLTQEAKLEAINAAREEEKRSFEVTKAEFESAIKAKDTEIEQLNKKVAELENAMKEIEEQQKKKEMEAKVASLLNDLESVGMELTDSIREMISQLAMAKLSEKDGEKALEEIKESFVAMAKKIGVIESSRKTGTANPSKDADTKDLNDIFAEIHKKYGNDQED